MFFIVVSCLGLYLVLNCCFTVHVYNTIHDCISFVYHSSHNTRTTTWEDPRKVMARHGRPSMHLPPHSHHPMPPYPSHAQGQQQQQQQPVHQHLAPQQSSVDNIPLPEGWQKAFTADGETYYVNHKNRTTSWFHPSTPQHQHSFSFHGGMPRGMGHSQFPTYTPPQSVGLHQQLQAPDKDMLQRSPFEMQQRQDHMLQQGMMTGSEAGRVPPVTLYNDPYLSSSSHERQASHDSGLGVTAIPYGQSEESMVHSSMSTDQPMQEPEQMDSTDLLELAWV